MALLLGTLVMTANFTFAVNRSVRGNESALVFGRLAMVMAAALGLYLSIRLKVNDDDDDQAAAALQTPILLTFGDRALGIVRRYPVASVAFATIVAFAWTLGHVETTSLIAALPRGIAEAVSVIAGFVFLGPALGLRASANPIGNESVG
jgi:hypothetical protein